MSLSNFTKFLLDAAFTMASAGAGQDQITFWLNLAEESHGVEPSVAEWAEVRQMIVDDFPELIERHWVLLPYLDQKAEKPHPTCGCGF